MRTGKNYVFLVLANLFWAGNFLFGAVVVAETSPLLLTFLRWLFALVPIVLLACVLDRPGRADWALALREWPAHLVQAALGLIGFCLFTYLALQHTTAVNAALISAVNPVLIAATAALLFRERPGRHLAVGLLVSLLGTVLLVTRGDPAAFVTGGGDHLGELAMIAAVACWALYTVRGRRLATPPVTASAVQTLIAVVLLAPFALPQLGGLVLSPAGWTGLAYISLFPSVLSLVLWNVAVRALGAGRSGIYLNLLPVFTVVIGVVIGIGVEPVQLVGGAVVLLGVWLSGRRPRASGVPGTADRPGAAGSPDGGRPDAPGPVR
ncbi:DMT family transporter [Mycetocola reblochoni]|uniref:Permease of the drug/metabolite transporter (DMT) superfamily n=2 Tax=Mycetocola reblochoni TaxID=331618 RepID=A0A1R4IKY5_9MICO|nr:DMT family transporter [Mycetocola reblochoni]RLP70155.1 DMT family transporter [Mycetocola reblochoni]SJN20315.1 Permease of the drug/metabolite transporter (DMT) superfamily [Mycetocola reblochoni REB411]